MDGIGIFSFGRRQSQRCPDKMLRPFAGTTLTDILLEKLAAFGPAAFFAGNDPLFRSKCQRHGVRFIERDARSAQIDEPIRDILSFLEQVEGEHLLLVNGCLPLLSLGTIRRFLEACEQERARPAFGVVRRRNYFMALDGRPLNYDPAVATINTKTVAPVYEFAHALYFFNRSEFLRTGRYWDWRQVRLVEMPGGREVIDIDTEDDFQLAEALWPRAAEATLA